MSKQQNEQSFEKTPEVISLPDEAPINNRLHSTYQAENGNGEEKVKPRKAIFGSIVIEEDINSDLLSPYEKRLYKGGMEILKKVVKDTNNIERMVLINPDMVSGVVGIQPLVSMNTGEAVLLYQAFRNKGIDFEQSYSFLEFGKERNYIKMLINHQAAESIMRKHQTALGLTLSKTPMNNAQVIKHVINLLNNGDARRANLAHGLLSGFPFEDSQYWVNRQDTEVHTIPPLREVENLDHRFIQEKPIEGSDKVLRIDSISLLDPNSYEMSSSMNRFLPDTREVQPSDAKAGTIEGFGLRWLAPLPLRKSTQDSCQRLLQIDRETGLLDFVEEQRSTFNVDDNIEAINLEKRLLSQSEKAPTTLGKIGGATFGILAIFSMFENMIRQDEENISSNKR